MNYNLSTWQLPSRCASHSLDVLKAWSMPSVLRNWDAKDGGNMSFWKCGRVEGSHLEESIKQCSPPQCHLKGDFYHEDEGKKDENWPLSEVRGHEWVSGSSKWIQWEESWWRYVACTEVELLASLYVVYCGPRACGPWHIPSLVMVVTLCMN